MFAPGGARPRPPVKKIETHKKHKTLLCFMGLFCHGPTLGRNHDASPLFFTELYIFCGSCFCHGSLSFVTSLHGRVSTRNN